MIRLLFFVVFAIFCDVCLTQRLCGLPRRMQPPPAVKYSIPTKPILTVGRPIIDNYDTIETTRVLNQLQDYPVKDDCGCLSSEIISKLIDALVVSTLRNNGRNEGNLLNIALGDTDLLGVSI
ncbi:unnamed protein product [Pieris brassicae]|uniref:Uncharacterized protein n=1 Tax=Pieris brassicae TaxID=7116 RepID=A0A9P0XAL0_PIEBR|nr:unnamed protein product [Pieris brassicae]